MADLSIDSAIAVFFFEHQTEAGISAAIGISTLANPSTVALIVTVLCAIFFYHSMYREIAGLLLCAVGSALAVQLIKMAIARPRPLYEAYTEIGYAFPSAHAAAAAALYGYLCWILVRRHERWGWKVASITLCCSLVALIGLSRLYLDEHFLTDVLAGFCIGALFAWLGARVAA